jgi:hypothetical protein
MNIVGTLIDIADGKIKQEKKKKKIRLSGDTNTTVEIITDDENNPDNSTYNVIGVYPIESDSEKNCDDTDSCLVSIKMEPESENENSEVKVQQKRYTCCACGTTSTNIVNTCFKRVPTISTQRALKRDDSDDT